MSCRELVEVVTDYLDGALPDVDRSRFEEHLEECDACRDYLEQIRRTIEVVGRLTPENLSDEAREGLLATFRGW